MDISKIGLTAGAWPPRPNVVDRVFGGGHGFRNARVRRNERSASFSADSGARLFGPERGRRVERIFKKKKFPDGFQRRSPDVSREQTAECVFACTRFIYRSGRGLCTPCTLYSSSHRGGGIHGSVRFLET